MISRMRAWIDGAGGGEMNAVSWMMELMSPVPVLRPKCQCRLTVAKGVRIWYVRPSAIVFDASVHTMCSAVAGMQLVHFVLHSLLYALEAPHNLLQAVSLPRGGYRQTEDGGQTHARCTLGNTGQEKGVVRSWELKKMATGVRETGRSGDVVDASVLKVLCDYYYWLYTRMYVVCCLSSHTGVGRTES